MNVWELFDDAGVWCVVYDGYYLEVEALMKRPGFFVAHVAEKVWGSPEVVSDLVDRVVQFAKGDVP